MNSCLLALQAVLGQLRDPGAGEGTKLPLQVLAGLWSSFAIVPGDTMSSSDIKRMEQSLSGKAHLGTFDSVSTPTSVPVVRGTPGVSGQWVGPCKC